MKAKDIKITTMCNLKQPVLCVESCSSDVLHEIFENTTAVNTSLFNTKFINEGNSNLEA